MNTIVCKGGDLRVMRSFCDAKRRIDCAGCADFVLVSAGACTGQEQSDDEKRFDKWKFIVNNWYCMDCAEDLDLDGGVE